MKENEGSDGARVVPFAGTGRIGRGYRLSRGTS